TETCPTNRPELRQGTDPGRTARREIAEQSYAAFRILRPDASRATRGPRRNKKARTRADRIRVQRRSAGSLAPCCCSQRPRRPARVLRRFSTALSSPVYQAPVQCAPSPLASFNPERSAAAIVRG